MMIELLFYHAPTLAALRGGRYELVLGLVATSRLGGKVDIDHNRELKQLAFCEIGPARTTMEEQITWHVLKASRC